MNSKRGPKPHQDRPTTIKLRLPSSLLDRLRRWAQTHGTTISDILRNGAEERMKGDSMAQTNDIFPATSLGCRKKQRQLHAGRGEPPYS